MKYYIISEQMLAGIINYLGRKPYLEVAKLIDDIAKLPIAPTMPSPSPPPSTPPKKEE